MSLSLAILTGVAVAAVLFLGVRLAARKSQLARSLSFSLYLAAFAAGLKAFTLFDLRGANARLADLDRLLSLLFVFLISVIAIRVIGLFFFDVYLHSSRGVRLPPLLPKVALGAAYLQSCLPESRHGCLDGYKCRDLVGPGSCASADSG